MGVLSAIMDVDFPISRAKIRIKGIKNGILGNAWVLIRCLEMPSGGIGLRSQGSGGSDRSRVRIRYVLS